MLVLIVGAIIACTGWVLGTAIRIVLEKEYGAWGPPLARLVARAAVRAAGRICRSRRVEWWADLAFMQRVEQDSGLPFAVSCLASASQLALRDLCGAAWTRSVVRISARTAILAIVGAIVGALLFVEAGLIGQAIGDPLEPIQTWALSGAITVGLLASVTINVPYPRHMGMDEISAMVRTVPGTVGVLCGGTIGTGLIGALVGFCFGVLTYAAHGALGALTCSNAITLFIPFAGVGFVGMVNFGVTIAVMQLGLAYRWRPAADEPGDASQPT